MIENEKTTKDTWNAEWRRMVVLGCLKCAFREFSTETFNAFRLYAIVGKPADEVAKELGTTANAVRIAKHRILVRMREFVEQFEQAF